jgi:hypothetical protein
MEDACDKYNISDTCKGTKTSCDIVQSNVKPVTAGIENTEDI